ncbi:hypothetical protein ACHAWF_015676, partial [Thalassiosira exigua]
PRLAASSLTASFVDNLAIVAAPVPPLSDFPDDSNVAHTFASNAVVVLPSLTMATERSETEAKAVEWASTEEEGRRNLRFAFDPDPKTVRNKAISAFDGASANNPLSLSEKGTLPANIMGTNGDMYCVARVEDDLISAASIVDEDGNLNLFLPSDMNATAVLTCSRYNLTSGIALSHT